MNEQTEKNEKDNKRMNTNGYIEKIATQTWEQRNTHSKWDKEMEKEMQTQKLTQTETKRGSEKESNR